MREEHVISRQGKKMVLYPGLLEEAHSKGLKKVFTTLIQIPTKDNGEVAIAKATVILEDDRSFDGIGDASPANVGKMILPHIIRMAETRAKARALRDAVNAGELLLDGEEESEEIAKPKYKPSAGERTPGGAKRRTAKELFGILTGEPFHWGKQEAVDHINPLSQEEVEEQIANPQIALESLDTSSAVSK